MSALTPKRFSSVLAEVLKGNEDYLAEADLDADDEYEDEYENELDWGAVRWGLRKGITFGNYTFSVADEYGGEGQGDEARLVVRVDVDGSTQYFRKDGYYSSYEGYYWDGELYEVSPREKTIIVYEKA